MTGPDVERVRYESGPILSPAEIVEGLERLRQIGAVNMLDRPGVIELARLLELDSTADWIEGHRREYAEAIFRGLAVEEPGQETTDGL